MDSINISFKWYSNLLLDRFEELKKRGWVGEAEEQLFPYFLGYLRDIGEISGDPDPSVIVDNFCVNAEIISREDFENNPQDYSYYGETWDDIMYEAIIVPETEEYAVMQL